MVDHYLVHCRLLRLKLQTKLPDCAKYPRIFASLSWFWVPVHLNLVPACKTSPIDNRSTIEHTST